jgi:glucose/arabinose dehydrogenase
MRVPIAALLTVAAACCEAQETVKPNPDGSWPSDAPAPSASHTVAVEPLATGLSHPWALEFLPDGAILLTERPGAMRLYKGGALSAPLAGVPSVYAQDQGGLLDVALAHDFATTGRIYFSYAEPREGGSGTTVAAATLKTDGTPRLEDVAVIFRQTPTFDNGKHYGSRIAVTADGLLLIGLGERFTEETRVKAQTLDNHYGKVVRIRGDGTVPDDNPFVGRDGALPEIWSFGHRNIQSAAIHPTTGRLWIVEHGPKGGDEVNIPEAGGNYGWPVVSHGINYEGTPVGSGEASMEGMLPPLYYWVPSIAPSGMAFYTGDQFPEWRGDVFIGALAGEHLSRLDLDDAGRVVGEERLLRDLGERIRDVAQGPDGLLYVITDEDAGRLLKISPG